MNAGRWMTGGLALVLVIAWSGRIEGQRTRRPPPTGSRTESHGPAPGSAMSTRVLVPQPVPIKGVGSWTIESRRHRGALFCFTVSPDGKHAATGGIDGTIRVWDLETGQFVRALVGHDSYVYGLSWSPRNNLLASAGAWDGTVRLWDVAAGKPLKVFKGLREFAHHVAWSPDGTKLAAAGAQSGWIWLCTGTSQAKEILEVGQYVYNLAWSPDGNYLAACGRQLPVSIIDVAATRVTRTFGTANDAFTTAAWSPDGRLLAAGSASGTIVWEVSEEKEVKKLDARCASVAWSPDGKQLATAGTSGSLVELWDAASGKAAGKLPGAASKVLWHPETKQIFTMSSVHFAVWDPGKAKAVRSVDAGGTTPPFWAPGQPIVTGLGTADLALWDAATAKFLFRLEAHTAPVAAVAWSRNGETLASACADKAVRLWDAGSGKLLHTLVGHGAAVSTVAWSPNGKLLASAGHDKTVRIWTAEGESQAVLEGHTEPVTALAWSPSSNLVASGSNDQSVMIWDPERGKQARTIQAYQIVQSLAWTSAGRTSALACGTLDDTIRIFNAGSGQQVGSLSHPGSPPNVSALAWLPVGNLLFSGRGNHSVQLWDVRAGKVVHSLPAMAPVQYVTSAANGSILVAGNSDRTVRFWDAASGQLRGVLLGESNCPVIIAADGNWRADAEKKPDLVMVVQVADSQLTMTPEEFATRFGWKNNPMRAKLGGRN